MAEAESYLSPDEAAKDVAEIAVAGARSPWAGHELEDDLLHRALREIAAGHPQPAAIAAAVLKSLDSPFPRWFA